ncbi:SDR family NAD(P)-dependent oxidoreductase [Neobacillus sp. NPDC058068]|uniref:SDR family NAD(P)-dependent oxidoreductase n=1 Tax=Neobacillus sp. NPDC058068 TaxID=3346325 RepID=UPI0036D9383D
MEKLLHNQVAFVTGAGSGIGRAVAIKLAQNGGKIALVDLHKENVEEVKKQIEEIGSEALVLEANVSQPTEVKNCYQKTIDQWGRLDVVFANAGINGEVTPIEDMEPKDWDLTKFILTERNRFYNRDGVPPVPVIKEKRTGSRTSLGERENRPC